MERGYKMRIYPNKEQAILINKTLGCSRFVGKPNFHGESPKFNGDDFWGLHKK